MALSPNALQLTDMGNLMAMVGEQPGRTKDLVAGRLSEIDGLRGWAALVVVLFHFIEEMFSRVSPSLENPWIASVLDGRLPVLIFFILSGDALSSAYFKKFDEAAIDRLLVKRYFRLTVPIFLSCLLVFLIMRCGFAYHLEAANILHREEWLGQFLQIDASVGRLMKYSFIDVYANHTRSKSFNPMLWTMSVEIIGSMIVFLGCYSWQQIRHPVATATLMAAFLMLLGSMYSLFLIGMVLSYFRRTGGLDSLRKTSYITLATWVAVLLSLAVNALFWVHNAPVMLYMMLAIGLVCAVYANNGMRAAFSNRISRYLGDISFPLYLTHFAVLISILSYGVVLTHENHRHVDISNAWPWVSGALVVALILASIFRWMEKKILSRVDAMVIQVLK